MKSGAGSKELYSTHSVNSFIPQVRKSQSPRSMTKAKSLRKKTKEKKKKVKAQTQPVNGVSESVLIDVDLSDLKNCLGLSRPSNLREYMFFLM